MRPSPLLLALPALSTAQQIPFLDDIKGWIAKATGSFASAVPSNIPSSIPSIPNPVASAAAAFAATQVKRLTLDNHKDVLKPGAATATPGLEEWLVFVTGGNKTCYGACGHAETAFNESVALISASPSAPSLAMLDCETDGILCHAWSASPPLLLHMSIPQPLADQSSQATIARYISVNRTTVTATEIAALHLQEKYKEQEPYEGVWHPFNGLFADYGVAIPIGYLIWGFSKVPSWMFMIGVSFLSRNIMSRRVAAQAPGGAPAAARPAAT